MASSHAQKGIKIHAISHQKIKDLLRLPSTTNFPYFYSKNSFCFFGYLSKALEGKGDGSGVVGNSTSKENNKRLIYNFTYSDYFTVGSR